MRSTSATVRLAVLVFACQVVAAALLLGGVGVYMRWQSAADVRARAHELRGDLLAVYGRDGAAALARVVAARAHRHPGGSVVLLADRSYRRIAGDLRAWPAGLAGSLQPAERPLARSADLAAEPMWLSTTTLPEGQHLLTAVALRGERRAIAVMEEATVAALGLALVLAVAAALASARMFARRLAEPVAALEAARHGDLSRRVADTGGGDSFAALARVVNATLARLERSIGDLTFATDAMAHDLKSPLTRLSAALDRAQGRDALPEMRAEMARAQDEAGRLLAIIDTALSIRRLEAGIGRDAFVPIDLATMLGDLAEIYGPVAEDAGRAIVASAAATTMVRGHRELLGQALGNLIDNALKYGAGTITLTAEQDGATTGVGVRDEGPGIAPGDRDTALRRFGRLDAARTRSGAGLGLSLVAAVATLHDGRLVIDGDGAGFVATLILARD